MGLVVSASLGQLYKNKAMPNVEVAGQNMGGKSAEEITNLLQSRKKEVKITLNTESKKLTPKLGLRSSSSNFCKRHTSLSVYRDQYT